MAASQIVWTPVPNGYANGMLRISVLVAPRLSGATTLSGFTDWLTWPQVKPAYSVTFQSGKKVPATITSPAPRLDLWQRLFTKDTPVAARPVPLAATGVPPIRSWPSVAARSMAYSEHTLTMAFNPTAPATVNDYFPSEGGDSARKHLAEDEAITDIYMSPGRRLKAIEAINTELAKGFFLGGALPGFSAAEINFLLAELFHNRKDNTNPAPKTHSLAAHMNIIQNPGDLDFHVALSSFAQYPMLQRSLGLIVDLAVDPAAIGIPIPSDPVNLTLEVDWPGAASYDAIYPVVAATLTKTAFAAKPSGTTTKDGFLALNTDQYGVIEVEADSAAALLTTFSTTLNTRNTAPIFGLKKAHKATTAARPHANGGGDSGGEPAPVPALRSSGFSVVQFGRAKQLHQTLTKTTTRAANLTRLATDPFSAEDLTYGVRVDVWDDTSKRWYSLCRRKGTYDVNGMAITAEDEGIVHLAHTQRVDDPTIYLHESVFNWSGYSLVTNRPGSTQEMINGKEVTVGPDSDATGPVKLKTSFHATGLPKLRYGRSYRFRARTVDITGNSRGPEDPATDSGSPVVEYLRFEAVTAPVLLPTAPRTTRESALLMVIRGNYNAPATGDCQRHVAQPRMSQLMAEHHGLYDVPASPLNPGGMDVSAYSDIAERDRRSLNSGGTADPDGWGDTHYHSDPVLAVPYITDVLARGVAFRGLPGTDADEIFSVDFANLLPLGGPNAFRIRLINGAGKPNYDRVSRVLTVRVPPGETVDVAYSSRMNDADVDLLGVWNWFVRSGHTPSGGRTVEDLRKLAAQGQLWQLTPPKTLRLSHAVIQPIAPPAYVKPVAVRQPGDTTARIIDVLKFHRASTHHVDVEATWTEPIDDPGNPEPTQRKGSAHVVKLVAAADDPEGDRLSLNDLHEFHDTIHRQVTFGASASSRYVEFFVKKAEVALSGTTPVTLAKGGIAPGTLTVTDLLTNKVFKQDFSSSSEVVGDYVVNHTAGTLARSGQGSAIADGATVAVEFVEGSVTRTNTEAQQPVVVNVRSSARPSVPDIAYIVPTFGWEKTADSAKISSIRRGNGLRVYLRRPWYSSGDGEILGVVLFEGKGDLPAKLRPYVTLRGQDPIFASAPTTVAPGMSEFPLAHGAKPGYRLAESDHLKELTETVAVAPHAVAYDKDRQMWYCDITMTQDNSYNPFVRLALARFQPNSLSGLEISPVVLAQFAQLNPDRTMSMVFNASDATLVHVGVAGTTYTAATDKRSHLKVLVQVADPKPVGAVGWRTDSEVDLAPSGGQWGSDIRLPAGRGSRQMRLVVEERERLSDQGTRLVYVDAIEI